MKSRVHCLVEVPDEEGIPANAFRVMSKGSFILLDFLQYDADNNSAVVVSRVKVRQDFVPAIRDRCTELLDSKRDLPEGKVKLA